MFGREDLKKMLANAQYSDEEDDETRAILSNFFRATGEDTEENYGDVEDTSIDDNDTSILNTSAEVVPNTSVIDNFWESKTEDNPEAFTINVDNGLQVLSMDGVQQKSTENVLEEALSDRNIGQMVLQGGGSCEQMARLLGDDTDYVTSDSEESDDEDHATKFDSELIAMQRKNVKRGSRRKSMKLPENLKGLLGEANISLCKGDIQKAMENCNKIVKNCPYSADAYHILASIYKSMNMTKEAINCSLASAFLAPNAQAWKNCAELLKSTDVLQAEYCLNRAIKSDPTDLDTHREYLSICETIGETQKTLKGYKRLVRHMTAKDGKEAMTIAREISDIYFKEKNYKGALKALQKAFVNHPNFITYNELHLALEVMIELPNYPLCIQTLVDFATVRLQKSKDIEEKEFNSLSIEEQLEKAIAIVTPSEFPVELKTKLVTCLVNLNCFKLCPRLIEEIIRSEPHPYGEYWLSMCESLHAHKLSAEAIPLLQKLAEHPEYKLAAILLLLAECLMRCERYEESANCFSQVVEMAPLHTGAKLSYSSVLEKMGETEAAKSVLDTDERVLSCALLYRQCTLHFEQGQMEDFIDKAKLLMLNHFVYPRSLKEADILIEIRKFPTRKAYLTTVRNSLREPLEESQYFFIGEDITPQQHWQIYMNLCNALYKAKRFPELQRFTIGARGSRIFHKIPEMSATVDFLCMLGCIHNEDFHRAFNILRTLVPTYNKCNRMWNLMAYVISKSDESRSNRFLLGLTVRYPDSLPLTVLRGNSCLTAGSYKFALIEYIVAFKEHPDNHSLALLTALTYIHMACQKFTAKKHQLVIQATAFLQAYWDLRGDTQEVYYNIGRAFHQLSQFNIAIHFYKLALETPPHEPEVDLTFCAAYNLNLIYKPNNKALARHYLRNYCTL